MTRRRRQRNPRGDYHLAFQDGDKGDEAPLSSILQATQDMRAAAKNTGGDNEVIHGTQENVTPKKKISEEAA